MRENLVLLISYPIDKLVPSGGGPGYLYNLKQGLEKTDLEYEFLPPVSNGVSSLKSKIKKITPHRLYQYYLLMHYRELVNKSASHFDYSKYDFIHYHSCLDLYRSRHSLENFGGKVILTSHCPEISYQEYCALFNPRDLKRNMDIKERLEKADEYAFSRADYIVFPCKEAEEPYFNTWPQYKELRDETKIRYLLTGSPRCKSRIDKEEIRARYGIPQDAFVISFVGRHNEVKGYPDLLKATKDLLQDENVYFLIAGKPSPLSGLSHSRWIEVGWTDDPHSIISASDLFVLPNKETYFDLVLLEVLSLGKPVLTTDTGGNRYFRKQDTGVFLYERNSSLAQAVLDIKDGVDLDRAGLKNKQLYEEQFTIDVFAKNYVSLIKSLES